MHHLDVRTARKLQRPTVSIVALAVLTGLSLATAGCQACGPPDPLVLLPLPPGAANVARSREGNPPPGTSLAMARGRAVVGDATIRARIAVVRSLRDDSVTTGPDSASPAIPSLALASDGPGASAEAIDAGAALVPPDRPEPLAARTWVDPVESPGATRRAESPEVADEASPPAPPVEVTDLLAPRPEVAALMDPAPLVCVNVNIASRSQLETLPRIGPAMASRIVEARPFPSVDALTRVRGIGPATLDVLRPLVCV